MLFTKGIRNSRNVTEYREICAAYRQNAIKYRENMHERSQYVHKSRHNMPETGRKMSHIVHKMYVHQRNVVEYQKIITRCLQNGDKVSRRNIYEVTQYANTNVQTIDTVCQKSRQTP